MAPGVNGSGKHTGTVPKSKTCNDGRRELDNRRDSGINSMSNNLIPESSQNASLKPSNTRACDPDSYETDGPAARDTDNRRRRPVPVEWGIHSTLVAGYPPASVKPTPHPRKLRHNTHHRLTCYSQPSLHPSLINHSHTSYHMMMASDEEEGASNFDSVRFQQPHPLNERNGGAPEWVDQGGSGEGRASREHMSPSGTEPQMRSGSKPRDEPDRNILPERENKSNITKMPDRNQVLSRLNQIRDYINQTTSLMDRMQNSRDPRVAVEYCKLTKMLLGLQDSERKLQDLLSTLKNLAECGEIDISGGCMGKMKQGNPDMRSNAGSSSGRNLSHDNEMNSPVANSSYNSGDMASAVAKSTEAGHRNELRAKLQRPETETTQNEGVNTAQDLARPPMPEVAPMLRKGKLDHLKERIQALKELYENRNQLMELLGDEDEELSSEHHALQNKLEDLQQKKSQMDQLVQELRTLNSFIPEDDIEPEAMNEPHRNEEIENEIEQPEHDIQEVLKNMEELKQMKERLAILQGMMSVTANQSQSSGNDGAVGGDKEDNAVNRRQDRENSKEPPNSSKPDNISLSSEAGSVSNADARQLYISTQELERKTLKLQEAKLRLQQLEKLLDVMQDTQKEGGSLTTEHYEQLIQAVGEDEASTASSGLKRDGSKDREAHVNDDHSLYSNSRRSPQKRYEASSPRESGPFHGNQQIPDLPRSRSSSTHGSMDLERRQNRATSPLASELSVEALNAITQNLREQAMTIRNERDRLAQVKWQISQRQRSDPAPPQSPPPSSSASTSSASSFVHRVKNRNAMSLENQSCRQLFLQAELQAKRRELEELMKKDRGHQTSINQDICSEISARKSEATGFIHGAVEGTTTNATWGGSTQGTLDDLVERDIEVQDQSGGYSSDEGQNEDETKEVVNFQQAPSFQEQRISQLNVSMARDQPNMRSQSSQRDVLNISLESQGRPKTSVVSNNSSSNTSSTVSNMNSSMPGPSRSSHGRSPVRLSQVQNLQTAPQHSTPTRNHMSTSHNIWKKDSHEGTAPRAVWTPSSRQENLCSADELVADSSANTNVAAGQGSPYPPMPSTSHHQPSQPNPCNSNTSWWQQQAQHLQNQLEATSSLCQSLMTEQQHHGGGGGQGCTLPGMPSGYNLAHPIGFATPQTAPSWPFPNASPWMLTPPSLFPSPDHSPSSLTLHSCTSHQLQQQQVLLTLSQCCHLLWLQHRELATLQATVQGIQEKVGRESRSAIDEDELRNIQMQHTQLQQPQVHPHAFPNRVTTPSTQTPYPLPMPPVAQSFSSNSLSRRLQKPSHPTFPDANREVMAPTDMSAAGGASGVSSAHSLPNLCASGTSGIMGLPHLLPQTADPPPGATYPYPPPEHLPPPPPPLGAASYTDHWALHPNHAARGPPVALNNQVPPGIRANNYWDNFRSYSRQNLLSTSSKTNEGFPHIPSPLVLRSHNFIRTASHGPHIPPSGLNASPIPVTQASRHSVPVQKEKLNTEQQSGPSVQPSANFMTQSSVLGGEVSSGVLYGGGAIGFSTHDLPWEPQQSPQESHLKDERAQDDSNRRHPSRERGGLFEVLRESVYSEVATLIAQNENRPHYLIQLFRDLQMVSCDALRQRTLHTIHRIVSRYLQESGKESVNGQVNTPLVEPEAELSLTKECDSSGDEDPQERSYHLNEEAVNYSAVQHEHRPESKHERQAVELEQLDSCGMEATGLALSCKEQGHLDKNIQSMLQQLLPLLKPHLNEPSSFMLLQNICLLAFQFLSSSINAEHSKTKDGAVSTSIPFHQLNSLLEETCLVFEGCKLKDVGEELLTSIGEVIVKAITSSQNLAPSSRKIPDDIEESEEEILEVGDGRDQQLEEPLEEERDETEVEAMQENCCDEDLAEADQSLGSGIGINSEVNESAAAKMSPCREATADSKDGEMVPVLFPRIEESFVILCDSARQEGTSRTCSDLEAKAINEPSSSKTLLNNEAFLECNGNSENSNHSSEVIGVDAGIDSMSISSDEIKNPPVKVHSANGDTAQSAWDGEEEIAVAAEEDINKNTQGNPSGNI